MSQAQIKTVSEFNSPNVHLLQENKKACLLQINLVILVVSVVGSTKVNARPALLGASSVSSAGKRTILQGNALSSTSNKVTLLEEESELPVFQVFKVSATQSPDSSLVTLKVLSGNFKRFEIVTTACCNVLPIHICKKATRDFDLKHVMPAKSSIVS